MGSMVVRLPEGRVYSEIGGPREGVFGRHEARIATSDRGENGISLLGITVCVIIEVLWSVRWSGCDRTGDKMVALDLEAG